MKTMLELLVRLVEMRSCCERAKHNPDLTESERDTAYCCEDLVRGCLPSSVLATYDLMKEADPELLECPEVFAMAVLVSTYRNLPPGPRRKFVTHFDSPPESKMRERQCKHRHLRRSIGASPRSTVALG